MLERRDTRDRLRVAEALLALPSTTAALAAGELPYTAVRALTAVLKPANESAWLEHVKGRTVREIETMVSGHAPGDLPGDPADPDLRTFTLRFELSPEDFALYRDARREVVRNAGHELTEAGDPAVGPAARHAPRSPPLRRAGLSQQRAPRGPPPRASRPWR